MKKHLLRLGDVVWVKLYGDGNIQNGIRPCVVIQNNTGNKYSPTIQIVPLTSRKTKAKLPTHVHIPANTAGLAKDSIAQCEGARPVLKKDILGFIGVLPNLYLEKIGAGLIINTPLIQFMSIEQLTVTYDTLMAS